MKAVICRKYGPPEILRIEEVAKPTPSENEVLVKVHCASVNYGDLLARKFRYVKRSEFNMPGLFFVMAKLTFGLRKPKIQVLGSEFSGMIESVGNKVTKFKPGDAVFGFLGQSMGAYAEYLTVKEDGVLALKPANLSFEEAAVVPYGALMALPLLRKMNLQAGHKVLINGASGGIGSAAVQIAKLLGALVTGVCSTDRVNYVHMLGADFVVDYTKEDFMQNGIRYDLIFDVLGKLSYSRCKNSLEPSGQLLFASFKTGKLFRSLFNKKTICAIAPGSVADLLEVKQLLEEGKLIPIVDKTFTMEQAALAHRYLEDGKAAGKVVISIMAPKGI